MTTPSREFDFGMERRLRALLAGVLPGEEDPVLIALLGEKVADIARRTGINSLVINPGSTSTKVDVFSGTRLVAQDEVHLPPGAPDGVEERVGYILGWLERTGLSLSEVTGIAARAGFIAPVPTGTYRVCEDMLADLAAAPFHHASNLSIPIAVELGRRAGPDVEITVTDPAVSDEVELVHRLTGTTAFLTDGAAAHYLSLKAACALVAKEAGTDPGNTHMVACHLGGGVSAVRFHKGRAVQVLHAFGSMPSANRAGRLPVKDLLLASSRGEYGLDKLRRDTTESGAGLLGMTGTNDFRALFSFRKDGATREQRMKIDVTVEFFANKIAAGIMELCAAKEPVDAVVLTGGLARDEAFLALVAQRIRVPARILCVPGSVEAEALAAGLIMACAQPATRKDYRAERDALARRRTAEAELLATTVFEKPTDDHRAGLAPSSIDELISAAIPRGRLPIIAIAGADNEEALLAAKAANQDRDRRLARFVLVGDFGRISQLAWELDVPVDDENFFLVEAADPTAKAVELLADGLVDTVMKGSVTTSALLKGYFQNLKARGLTSKDTKLSHLCLFDIPGRSKLVAVTDAAINPSPTTQERVVILENALAALHALGLACPKVAVISATEKPSEKVASSMEGKAIAELFAGRDDVVVDGPISVDLSLSPESVREKGYRGKVRGDADLLLVPNLDSGNAVYKAFTTTAGATAAGAVIGGEVPLILTSRGDSSKTKLASIALALLLRRNAENRRRG